MLVGGQGSEVLSRGGWAVCFSLSPERRYRGGASWRNGTKHRRDFYWDMVPAVSIFSVQRKVLLVKDGTCISNRTSDVSLCHTHMFFSEQVQAVAKSII